MKDINEVTGAVLGAAVRVHKALGPGLLESAYEACLAAELAERGIPFRRQVPLPITYRDVELDTGYRLDLLIDERVVVEVKSVASLEVVFTAQVLTCLKLGSYEVGLLINFNVRYLGEGAIRRLVSGYKSPLPRVPRAPR